MSTYLQTYGEGDERRGRIIRILVLSAIALLIVAWILYLILHNYSEKKTVQHFLDQVNARQYQQAYADFGCTDKTPCPNYDYQRFLRDWAPQKPITSPWRIVSLDGCKQFVTINVQAGGTELESLAVERGTHTVMYAPSAECQEPKWHWKQFFQRLFGGKQS
ncbi:MAG TPA: hypothetical protein VKX25_17025 [Bryobacteraceae bacterium]|jgi:hypothetical protein|nr:hypothetical protein [Bryobacteraceae bacterium]